MISFIHNDIVWEMDPNGKFPGVDAEGLVDLLGIIPTFIVKEDTETVALDRYMFGGPPMTGGRVAEDGTYHYPGDPPLPPVSRCQAGDTRVYVYQFGMITFVKGDKVTTYRFD